MPYAVSDGATIYYETTGGSSGWPIVLLEGTGAQLIATDDRFCDLLAAEGFFVIRLDNRDVGMSQKFGGRRDLDGRYELSDMAGDVIRVLDDLDLERSHILGHSMGGMMAQTVAIEHPERLRSLVLVSTIPGRADSRYFPDGTGAMPALEVVQPRFPRAVHVALAVWLQRRAHSGTYPFDKTWAREAARRAYDRGYAPDGIARQWTALKRAPERLERLREVRAPTLVIHGRADNVLLWPAAVDIAEAIADAELHIYPGMGHSMVRELWPAYVAEIVRVARRYEESMG